MFFAHGLLSCFFVPFFTCQLMKEILGLNQENCILITNEKNWVEQAAKDQLCGVGRLPGVIKRALSGISEPLAQAIILLNSSACTRCMMRIQREGLGFWMEGSFS